MRLINRCSCRRLGYDFYHSRSNFRDQMQLIAILACLFGHLALFQLVGASTQSSSSLSLLLANGIGNASQKEWQSRGQAVIASVPTQDRGLFVIYHLAKALNSDTISANAKSHREPIQPAIPQAKSLTFKDIQVYDRFSGDLLKWTMRTFEWSQSDVSELLRCSPRKVFCTRKGWCFNASDMGSLCCPF